MDPIASKGARRRIVISTLGIALVVASTMVCPLPQVSSAPVGARETRAEELRPYPRPPVRPPSSEGAATSSDSKPADRSWASSRARQATSGPVSAAATPANGGFETGTFTGWTVVNQPGGFGDWYVYSGSSSPESGLPITPPPEGAFAAVTDQFGPGSHILYQDVTLPSGSTYTLTFLLYYINWAGVFFTPASLDYTMVPNQQYRVDVLRSTAAPASLNPVDILGTPFRTQVGDPAARSPMPVSFDLTPFAGQTIRLRFAQVDNQNFFNASVDRVQIISTPPLAPGALLGTDASGGNLIRVDLATGAGTLSLPMGIGPVPALAFDPSNGTLYAGRGGGFPGIYRIDPASGTATFVGNTGLGFAAVSDLAFSRDGTLYAAVNILGNGGTGGDHLARIDKATGLATVVGPFGTCNGGSCTIQGIEGITFDPLGRLWASHSARSAAGAPGLYRVNPATGAAAFVAPITIGGGAPPSGGVVALTSGCDGVLYGGTARAAGGATDGGRLLTINPSTGQAAYVGAGHATAGTSLGALAIVPPCQTGTAGPPAPTSTLPPTGLVIQQTASPAVAVRGSVITYTIRVLNAGLPTSAAVITDTLPPGVAFLSAGATPGWSCVYTDGQVVCTGGTPTIGEWNYVIVKGTVTDCQSPKVNTAQLEPASLVLAGSSSTASTTTPVLCQSDLPTPTPTSATPGTRTLAIKKTADPNPVVEGNTLSYTIQVVNLSSTTTGIVITDTLPADVTFLNGYGPAGWSCAFSGGTWTCSGGSAPTGQPLSFYLRVRVTDCLGPRINTVSATQNGVTLASDTTTTAVLCHTPTVTPTATRTVTPTATATPTQTSQPRSASASSASGALPYASYSIG